MPHDNLPSATFHNLTGFLEKNAVSTESDWFIKCRMRLMEAIILFIKSESDDYTW